MSGSKHHHAQEGPHPTANNASSTPYWKRAHHDWRFWIAVVFIFAAIAIYVVSVDLSLVPRPKRSQTFTRTP